VHWNVVGPNFIGVHEMIDPQVELVRGYADEVAERIATLGKSPLGTPGAIINDRTWDDYRSSGTPCRHIWPRSIWSTPVSSRTPARVIDRLEDLDLVSQDMLSSTPASWRSSSGSCAPTWRTRAASWPTDGAKTEKAAASRAKKKAPVK
jgi:starvation-inducible DNA-binding protein